MINPGEGKSELDECFESLSQINRIDWEQITETIQDLKQEFDIIGSRIAGMCKENELRVTGDLEEQLDRIDDELVRLKEESEDQKNVIEECQETAETQQQAAMELFRDLGFDTSQLMTNETLDFTNPNVLYNLQKQMERFKK